MILKPGSVPEPFEMFTEHRPWGYYERYGDNVHCTPKILYVKKNEMLSMQYHFKRDQFYLVLDDHFIVEYSSKPIPVEILDEPNEAKRFAEVEQFLKDHLIVTTGFVGSKFGFKRHVIHRVTYVGEQETGKIFDLAFGVNDETDIVRVKDEYGRESKKLKYYDKTCLFDIIQDKVRKDLQSPAILIIKQEREQNYGNILDNFPTAKQQILYDLQKEGYALIKLPAELDGSAFFAKLQPKYTNESLSFILMNEKGEIVKYFPQDTFGTIK